MELGGIFAAVTTPFDAQGGLRLDRLAANFGVYRASGLRGVLVLGSSGEAIYLDQAEKIAVLEAAAEALAGWGERGADQREARGAAPSKGGASRLAGTGEESLRGTLEMTARAAALGYQAAVVRTPHYYKKNMTAAALAGFYRTLADEAALPIVLYNIPPLTGVDLGLATVLELAQHPRIVGLKESSGNMDKLVRIAAERPDFPVLVGGASTVYPSLCAGAKGAILALAAAAPAACCAVYDAFRQGDHDLALAAQRALLGAAGAFEPLGIAGLKAALDAMGLYGGPPRAPQLALTAAQREAMAGAFASLRELATGDKGNSEQGTGNRGGGGAVRRGFVQSAPRSPR